LLIDLFGQLRSEREPLFGNGLNGAYLEIGIAELLCLGKLLILNFLLVGYEWSTGATNLRDEGTGYLAPPRRVRRRKDRRNEVSDPLTPVFNMG
jgi:hypothetical protein